MDHINAQIARRWFEEMWNQQKEELIDQYMDADCEAFMEGPRTIKGPPAFKEVRKEFLALLPNMRFTVEDIIANNETAAIRWLCTATHSGDALNLKATGKRVEFRGTTWMTFRDGKIVNGWDTWNLHGLLNTCAGH